MASEGRYYELKTKAKEKLTVKWKGKRERLASAIFEILFLKEEDVPERYWQEVKTLINAFFKEEPKGEESKIRASINAMTDKEINQYIERIKNL